MNVEGVDSLDSAPTKAFVDGAYVDAASGETFNTLIPSTGEILASVASRGPADVDIAVAKARSSFERGLWRRTAPRER